MANRRVEGPGPRVKGFWSRVGLTLDPRPCALGPAALLLAFALAPRLSAQSADSPQSASASPTPLPPRANPPLKNAAPETLDAPLPAPRPLDPGLPLPPAGDAAGAPSDGTEEPLPPTLSYRLFPWTAGNRAELLTDATAAFPAIFAACEKAERSILVESYIFGDDERVGDRMLALLADKARAGLQVRLIIDGLGSEGFPEEKLAALRAAGGGTLVFRPMNLGRRLLIPFGNLRDHRKMVVVDGRIAFVGGINLADDERDWHDFAVRIEGPAAAQAARLFTALWLQRTKELLGGEAVFPTPELPGGQPVRVVGNQARAVRWEFYAAYRDAIRAAKREVIIANAYFLPDHRIRKELYAAVRRGVRVELLLPADSDIPVVQAATEHLYRKLMRRGIQIRLYGGRVLHAKVAVIDGRWATVGSYNLETQSLRNNLEANAVIDDPVFGMALREALVNDLAAAHAVTLKEWEARPWLKKLRGRWWYTFRALM